MTVHYFGDGSLNPPLGVRGGHPGRACEARRRGPSGDEPLPPIGGLELVAGEWIVGIECGGGGYGDPAERNPERVREDVLEGWVTLDAARELYRVAFVGSIDDESLAVDVAATAALRGVS